MKISIQKETGTPMFMLDQLLLNSTVKECYKHFGIHGLHYAILFGWTGSPYRSKADIEERDMLAYDAVKSTELYDTVKGKIAKSDKLTRHMYKNPFIKQAINTINELAKVPILELRYFFVKEIDILKQQIENVKWDKDATTLKKQVDTHKIIMESIKNMTKEIESIDAKIEEKFKIEKYPSLNDLIMLATNHA